MEKEIITKGEVCFGGKAHGCTFADGRQATAWNDKVDAGVLMQAFSSGEEIEVELVHYTSKLGKKGLNIVEVKSGTTAMTSESPSLQEVHDAKQGNAHTDGQYQSDGSCKYCDGKGCKACSAAPTRQSVKGSAYEKDPVGLAVELMVNLINRCPAEKKSNLRMQTAIDLVKQAQEAFK